MIRLVCSRISDERWRQVSTGVSGLFNRVVSGAYPPGSTFKPFTAIAALEAGVADLTETILCSPSVSARYFRKRCAVWSAGRTHGRQNLTEGMINSCNIVFYELGRLTADQMASAAKEFGLRIRQVALYPDGGFRGSPRSRRAEVHAGRACKLCHWTAGYRYSASDGCCLWRDCNSWLDVRPRLVRQVIAADGSVVEQSAPEIMRTAVLSDSTWDYLHDSLSKVPQVGTAVYAFQGFEIPVGKTGTAEVPPGTPRMVCRVGACG